MAILSAEINFKKGLLAIVDDNYEQASRFFRSAIDIHEQRASDRPDWRYLSYYGLSIAKACRPDAEAIEACRTAAEHGTVNADLYLNLGKVYLLAGKSRLAREAFERGLELEPAHPALVDEMRLMEQTAPVRAPASRRTGSRSNRWIA